jgi:transcriptional antiterminator NusG
MEGKHWYVVQAYSGMEHKVKATLEERIEREELASFFGDILVPTEEVVEMREGVKRRSERKFFPGYVLVEMEMNDASWHLVKSAPNVLGFIGGKSDKPVPITESEVQSIMSRMEDGAEKPRPKVLFEPGELVRVVDGPFKDFTGEVAEVNFEKNTIRVSLMVFGRPTPVELEFHEVEKG